MPTVSLLIEILRTQPRLMFWLVTLGQALLWLAVPALFYAAPPGALADVLAIGREMNFASTFGFPLGYWLPELALRAAGGHIIGVYLLAQICIVVTYWAIFQLGRRLVGERQALLAIMLMVGISVFTIASPDFSPDLLMMPLWALSLLLLWRAVGENRPYDFLLLAGVVALMLFTSPLGLLLLLVMTVFVVGTARGRSAAKHIPALAAAIIMMAAIVLWVWLMKRNGLALTEGLPRLPEAAWLRPDMVSWLRLVATVLAAQAGAAILIVLAANLTRTRKTDAVAITGAPADRFAQLMMIYGAVTPLVIMLALAAVIGITSFSRVSPLLVAPALAVIVAAGSVIYIHHQRLLGIVWFSLLLAPPALIALGVLLGPPLFAVDLKVAQPAEEIGRYFAENFERRTGQELAVVGGDRRLATLIALAAPSRPRVLDDGGDGRPQLATRSDANQQGAIIVWRATDRAGTPPDHIKAQFPEIVPEIPRAFDRLVQGRAPLLRIGWGMIRPAAPATEPSR